MNANTIESLTTRSARVVLHPASQVVGQRAGNMFRRIALPVRGIRFITAQEVIRCESEGNYCKIRLVNGEQIMLAKTLKWVIDLLPKSLFIRTHASHVIAIDQIKLLAVDHVQLMSGDTIPLARARREEVKTKLL